MQNAIADTITPMFEGVGLRFDVIDQRFDGIDQRFDGIDSRLDKMDKRFDGIDSRLDKMSAVQANHGRSLGMLQTSLDQTNHKLDELNGRVLALEADVRELYLLMADSKKPKPGGKTLEEKVLRTFSYLTEIAAEAGITLPSTTK